MIKDLKFRTKLGIGFGVIILFFIGAVLTSIWQAGRAKEAVKDYAEIRSATARASLMMLNGMNHSLAALRGWTLLGDHKFREERSIAWDLEILPSLQKVKTFSTDWLEGESLKSLNLISGHVENLKIFQKEIEEIAQTLENTPATKILLNEAVPKATIMAESITKMIDLESNLEATPARKDLLGVLADIRGSLGLGLANMRAYLLSGDAKFKNTFNRLWEKNELRFGKLVASVNLLSPEQFEAYNKFVNARSAFAHLPKEMCDIRGSSEWNKANYLLKTKASPIAAEIKRELNIMVAEQNRLMKVDLGRVWRHTAVLDTTNWILLAAGVVIGIVVCVIITRSVTVPARDLIKTLKEFGSGNLNAKSNIHSEDEIGMLAKSFDKMSDDLRVISNKQKDENWLNFNLADVSATIQTISDIQSLADFVIREITQLIKCGYCLFYIKEAGGQDEPVLNLCSSFGYKAPKNISDRFKLREGLVGQCAFDQKSNLLTQVPGDHIKITTGLGESAPLNILLQPVLFNGETLGVIEIASLYEFTNIQVRMLDKLSVQVGNALNNIKANRTEALLKKSQELGEMLQAQQEELRLANEEMEEKSAELEAQSDELRAANEQLGVQAEEYQTQSEELKAANSVLEQKKADIEEARKDLEKKAAELELVSKYKSEFLSNMSHELRTPLNSMLILSKSFADNEDGNLSEDQIESSKVIYNGGEELLSLINEILDLSKIEAGKLTMQFEEVELNSIKLNMNNQFKPVAKEKGLEFTVDVAGNLPNHMKMDRQRTEQVLKNLLSNAFKFTKLGSVNLKIHTPAKEAKFNRKALAHEKTIAFSVIDTGIGIPEDRAIAIFEAFQQGDGSTSRKYGGTGLGLTISKELARLMGGEIQLESIAGAGSTFTLYLPLDFEPANIETESPKIEPTPSASTPPARVTEKPEPVERPVEIIDKFLPDDRDDLSNGARSILIIEDDVHFARILLSLSRKKGYKCLVAGGGRNGLDLAFKYLPNAIILDLKLPDMDGGKVLDQLKFDLKTRHIPVHIVSCMDEDAESLQKGAIGFLSKPVDADSIEDVFNKFEKMFNETIKQLLIVDNDKYESDEVIKLVKRKGIEITTAVSGKETLEKIKYKHFDCIILCMCLQDMSSYDLLSKIDKDKSIKMPPVIVHTEKEINPDEYAKLLEFTKHFVLKDTHSADRLLDEVSLFLHSVESSMPASQKKMIGKFHDSKKLLEGRKILLVDDDMRNVFALTKVLQNNGMNVLRAGDGQMALDILNEHDDVELALMDIMMPIMDGYESMGRIRKMIRYKKMPIIALTAKAMPEDKIKCIDAGASDYLTKPVDMAKLLSVMKVWLYNNR